MRIGIDLEDEIEGIILDQAGVVVEKIRIPTPDQEYKRILYAITAVVSELQSSSNQTVGRNWDAR